MSELCKRSFHQLRSLDGSDSLKTVVRLFDQRLRATIAEGTASQYSLTPLFSSFIDSNPFQAMGGRELGFSWIAYILNSRYHGDVRYMMASKVVQALGKHLFSERSISSVSIRPTWIPPILGFLSLSKKLDTTSPLLDPVFIALRILSASRGSADFGATILPILTSTLLPTHPLQSRALALNIFVRFTSGWFSPQTESVPSKDLDKFLRAVGDPFKFPDLPLHDGEPISPADYQPMMAAVVLMGFASSDLWRGHLNRSQLISCEETASTREGQRSVLGCMLTVGEDSLPEFLCSATKVGMAIGRLEELRCFNLAEVVIMWAWTAGVVNPVDHDGWRSIGHKTLRFYRTHGMGRLITLRQHIINKAWEPMFFSFLSKRHWISPERVGGVQESIPKSQLRGRSRNWYRTDFCLAQACQVRRFYHLFGYDPTTWEEAVAAEVDGKRDLLLSGRSVLPVSCVDWGRDYP
jgi:hypothetical protein